MVALIFLFFKVRTPERFSVIIMGFGLAFAEPWLAHPRVSSEYCARCYPDRTWRRIGHHSYRPTNSKQLRQCLGGNQLFHDWIGDAQGTGGHTLRERTDLDPGAPDVGSDDLICERHAHRVEIYMPRHRVHIAGLNSAYQHQ